MDRAKAAQIADEVVAAEKLAKEEPRHLKLYRGAKARVERGALTAALEGRRSTQNRGMPVQQAVNGWFRVGAQSDTKPVSRSPQYSSAV